MPYFLSPIGNSQIVDANGDPLVGGSIWTYLAGTSTGATTYTDDTGGTPHGLVIGINSLGLPVLGPVWMLGGQPLKFIIKNAANVTLFTFDDISGIGDASATPDQFPFISLTPTYISATSFSMAGDQTNDAHINRRIRSINNGGTVYSTIIASVFSAGVTTVTVLNDSTALDSGLSQVNYALLTALNSSVPMIRPTIGTKQNTTAGTSIDFTGIPPWARRITLSLSGVSTSGASNPFIQLGDSGGIEAIGYIADGYLDTTVPAITRTAYTLGFGIPFSGAANTLYGHAVFTLLDPATNLWVGSGYFISNGGLAKANFAGSKALSGTLDRIRLTTVGGADTFDAGMANILYE